MATLDELMNNARNPYSGIGDNARSTPSLLEQKQQKIYGSRPQQTVSVDQSLEALKGPNNDSNLVDLFQAESLRQFGSLADSGKWLANSVLGTKFDDTRDSGWSNQEIADQVAGVSEQTRAEANQKIQNVADPISRGDYWEAAMNVPAAIPSLAATSLPSLGAYALGNVGPGKLVSTGGKALGKVANAIRKGGNVTDVLEGATKHIPKTSNKWLDNVKKAAKATPQEVANTSLITADLVQQSIADYRDQNQGQDPSTADVLKTAALTAATTAASPWMVRNLYMPKGLKNFGKPNRQQVAKAAKAGKEVVDPDTLGKKIHSEIANVVSRLDESALRSLGRTVLDNGKKVLAAGSGEAVQEYAQTWAGIIGTNASVHDPEGFFSALVREWQDEGNRNEALTSAFLGGGTGAGIKAAINAPKAAFDTTAHLAKGTANKTKDFVQNRVQKGSENLLSQSELQARKEEFEERSQQIRELKEENVQKEVEITQASTFEDIKDPDLQARFVDAAGDISVETPEGFNKARKNVIRTLRTEAVQADLALKKDFGVAAIKTAGKSLGEAAEAAAKTASEIAGIDKETFERVIESAKQIPSAVKKEILEFNTSATYGLTLASIEYGSGGGKKAWKKLQSYAKESSPDVIDKVSSTLAESMPNVAQRLKTYADKKRKSQETLNVKSKNFITSSTLDPSIKRAANTGKIKNRNGISLGLSIRQQAKANFDSADTIDTVMKSIEAYENSGFFKQQMSGAMSPDSLNQIKQELLNQRDRIQTPVGKAKDAAKSAFRFVDPYVSVASDKVSESYKATAKKIDEAFEYFHDIDIESPDLPKEARTFRERVKTHTETFKDLPPEEAKQAEAFLGASLADIGTLEKTAKAFKTKNTRQLKNVMRKLYPAFESNDKLGEMLDNSIGAYEQSTATKGNTSAEKDTKSQQEVKENKKRSTSATENVDSGTQQEQNTQKEGVRSTEKEDSKSTVEEDTESTSSQQEAVEDKEQGTKSTEKEEPTSNSVEEDAHESKKHHTVFVSEKVDEVDKEVFHSLESEKETMTDDEIREWAENNIGKGFICND